MESISIDLIREIFLAADGGTYDYLSISGTEVDAWRHGGMSLSCYDAGDSFYFGMNQVGSDNKYYSGRAKTIRAAALASIHEEWKNLWYRSATITKLHELFQKLPG